MVKEVHANFEEPTLSTPIRMHDALNAFYVHIVESKASLSEDLEGEDLREPGYGTLQVRRGALQPTQGTTWVQFMAARAIYYPDRLTKEAIDAFIAERIGSIKPRGGATQPSRSHANSIRESVRLFVRYCALRGWMTHERAQRLTAHIKSLSPRTKPALIIPKDRIPEAFTIAEGFHPADRMTLETNYYMLTRNSESRRLVWGNFALNEDKAHFVREKQRDIHTMRIGEEYRETVLWWRGYVEERHGPVQSHWPVLPARTGFRSFVNRKMNPAWPIDPMRRTNEETGNRVIKRVLKAMGYGDAEIFNQATHVMRRSSGAHMWDDGIDPNVIRENFGHEDIEMTLRYIRRAINETALKAAANRPIKRAAAALELASGSRLSAANGVADPAQVLHDFMALLTPQEMVAIMNRQQLAL